MAQAPTAPPARYMQGIAVPASSVDPLQFFAKTRRHTQMEKSTAFAGLGATDTFELKKSDIIAGIVVKMYGSIVITTPTGTVSSTARWPHDFLRYVRFTANGQSNIINVSGAKLKAREFMAKVDLNDRGVSQSFNGATVVNGTLSQSSDAWGVGSAAASIAAGTYPFELSWYIPVAEDEVDLNGSIFAQTSSTDLNLQLQYAAQSDIFTTTGTATVAVTATTQVDTVKYSIPLGADGNIVVPDLSIFHSMIETRTTNLANGDNEIRLVGQGAGKTLLRLFGQVWNNNLPLVVNRTNFSNIAWRFGSNETPDIADGSFWRYWNERDYTTDIGANFGFYSLDFARSNAFRDAVDLGTTSEFRQLLSIPSGVTLTNPALETVTETIFAAGAGA